MRLAYENNPVMKVFFNSLFSDVDREMRNKVLCNFVVNSVIMGWPRRVQVKEKEHFAASIYHPDRPHQRLQPQMRGMLGR